MKKYKLIREYPGSPKPIGLIYEAIPGMSLYKHPTKDNKCIKSEHIENIPEFWEKIIEKNYEILEIKFFDVIYNRFDGSCFYDSTQLRITDDTDRINIDSINFTGVIIYKVKRLSDSKVFTIGDKVLHTNNVSNRNGIIEEFHIMSNGLWFKCNNYDIPMCYTQEKIAKTPLFTTKDGVNIFKGDNYFKVLCHTYNLIEIILACRSNDNTSINFSTKEAAEEYILMNKPCLSVNDVMNNTYFLKDTPLKALMKLVKSKL